MIVYHGSNTEIASPDIRHSRARVDFGPGFYVTPLREQVVLDKFVKFVGSESV